MAQMAQNNLVVSISKLYKNNESPVENFLSDEQVDQLCEVIKELVGENVLVEIERA